MATQILDNAYITIGGNDISNKVTQVTFTYEAEMKDDTTMGDTTRSSKGGLKNWSLSITAYQDWADNDIDEDLFAIVGTSVAIALRPENTTISASNPEYQMYGAIQSITPVSGSIGDMAQLQISIVPSKGTNASTVVRDVTP